MNKQTLALHNKGWTAVKACERWGFHYDSWNRKCNNPRLQAQLWDMINGLPDNNNVVYVINPPCIIKENIYDD